ncbi:MAG: hypothetical protein ACOCQL_00105 [Halolamina sp.]
MPSPPFVDRESGELDLDQIRAELFPLAALVVLFGAAAVLVFLLGLLVGGSPAFAGLFTILSQFVLALGTGIVLIYVIARGIQLADAS